MNHRKLAGFLLSLFLGGFYVASGRAQSIGAEVERPHNVILFVSDGGGPASFTLARDYVRWKEGREALVFDSLLVGAIRTFSSDSRVTDSAAGATAFSAGVKTYNGAIAVDADRRPVGTILEGAERKRMATGLVATSRFTHATPACFAAHVTGRWMENEIASQMLVSGVDVLMGGGRRHLLPDSASASSSLRAAGTLGVRTDGRDLISEARSDGYHIVSSRDELMQASEIPLLATFSMSQMDYEVDRDPAVQPSLAEMTERAIELLENASDEGFFLMVEGSRIDHAAHANDAAGHLHDLLAYEEALAVALDYSRRNGRTLVVATSDHETGGLTVGRDGEYAWYPEVVDVVTATHDKMIEAIRAQPDEAAAVFQRMAGVDSLIAEERGLLATAAGSAEVGQSWWARMNGVLAEIIGKRALLGWTSGGHTAVDVNVYAYGPGHEHFEGNRDNTHIGLELADLMGLDLQAITAEVRRPLEVSPNFEIVGHRGARGLLPENSIPSFRRALELGVNTLEIDVVVTKDEQVVVSHEPWMHHTICATSEGAPITQTEARSFNIYQMTYDEVAGFDCGTRGHVDFPEQETQAVHKPLLSEVIEMGEDFTRSTGRTPPWYNIEIKANPEWDGTFTPAPEEFMPLVHDVLAEAGVKDRAIIQSFDPRPLRVMHQLDPSLRYALLVGRGDEDTLAENIDDLGFVPYSYNPNYHLVDEELIEAARRRGMEVVPWTVNSIADMRRLMALGVDGLITDYPDRARHVLRRQHSSN